jgi:nucleoside transporter
MSVKFRLGAMMFLQYAIWGSWSPVLSDYLLNRLGFSGPQVGFIYSLLPLATIISPFIGGQVADRYFPTQRVIAILQLLGGGLLIFGSRLNDFSSLATLMLIYCLIYAPTLALTNSIAFINLHDSEKEFGQIRVWGTIGWIVAGLLLAGWRLLFKSFGLTAVSGDTLLLAGILSLIMGLTSFRLPHTPPKKEATKPWAFLEAIRLLKEKNLVIFIIIAFVVATELMFYYVMTAPYLTSAMIGVSASAVSGVMVIAQIAEIFVMAFLLPYFLPRFGIRTTLLIGILAWPLRYIIFVIGRPAWLVIASLSLHGFCYVFFFTAAFIYIDRVAPSDIRASAQSLITLATIGLGNYLGSLFAGWIQALFTGPAGTNWRGVFAVPAVLTILCALIFFLFFRTEKNKEESGG